MGRTQGLAILEGKYAQQPPVLVLLYSRCCFGKSKRCNDHTGKSFTGVAKDTKARPVEVEYMTVMTFASDDQKYCIRCRPSRENTGSILLFFVRARVKKCHSCATSSFKRGQLWHTFAPRCTKLMHKKHCAARYNPNLHYSARSSRLD